MQVMRENELHAEIKNRERGSEECVQMEMRKYVCMCVRCGRTMGRNAETITS